MASLDSHTPTGCTESLACEWLDIVTAKNSVLKSPELMAMTFSHLQFDFMDYEDRLCLLNAALTCKDFLDLGLNALWEKLYSLVPLLKLLPALQIEDDTGIYVRATSNVHVLYMTLSCLQFLSGNVSQADCDRLQYYSRKVKSLALDNPDDLHPSTYIRIAQLLQSTSLFPSLRHLKQYNGDINHISLFQSPLLESLELRSFRGFENTIVGPFLASLPSQLVRRIVLNNGQISGDIFKKSFVHFKQLRSLELAVFMSDFTLLEVLGTLPSLADLTLKAIDPASHPAHDAEIPENSNHQSASGGPKYFEALETLSVTGSFFFIQHLLGFIDSPCLATIRAYPVIDSDSDWRVHVPDQDNHYFTPFMTIIASKWPQSLENLLIDSNPSDAAHRQEISKCLTLLKVLHEMRTFQLNWKMKNADDDVRRLVMSWPKLILLNLDHTFISLSTLRIIAEKCPELRYLHAGIQLEFSTIPPFESSSKSLRHKLEILSVPAERVESVDDDDDPFTQTLECQIQVARHLDFIFPHLKSIKVQRDVEIWPNIYDLVKLCKNVRQVQY
jgi:hypothetical protein